MKREITLSERKEIQLKMLQEMDSFCRSHNIRYSLAYGTLIGALRHKGYIPWDDDVDIIMPLPDLLKFKNEFVSENIQYCDVDTCPGYEYPFPRLAYKPTYKKTGLVKKYGVNIDLYFTVGLSDNDDEVNSFFKEAEVLLNKRLSLTNKCSLIYRFLPIKSIPVLKNVLRKERDLYVNSFPYEGSNRFFAVSGFPIWGLVYDFDLFKNLIDVPFENLTLLSTAEYHKFLTQEYGDYMQLPPEDKRVPGHHGDYYWK